MKLTTEPWDDVIGQILNQLSNAPVVDVGEWQSLRGDLPQARTVEVEDFSFKISIPSTDIELQQIIEPNLPWAEDHFQERISGIPYNPPPSSSWWPFATQDNKEFKQDEKFSHTYPERMWPKWAGNHIQAAEGIRYPWGDLDDVVRLLKERPGTRQAYLPIWFPEDTGAVEGQRVPCTLGYHFLVRNGALKVVYFIRSCDYYRHFRDDVYMAARLGQWVALQIGVRVGSLTMHISSLHIFERERGRVENEYAAWRGRHSEAVTR